jgi:chromosome segregation ATPase
VINQKNLYYVSQIGNLAEKYEERLSNTLIHSNSQNTKLNEELGKVLLENDQFKEKIREMSIHIDSQHSDIESLTLQLNHFRSQLEAEEQRFAALSAEFESFKQSSLLSNSDQINELTTRIDGLNDELKNMGLLLESTTNNLGETELSLELKVQELESASAQIEELNTRMASFESGLSQKELEFAELRSGLEASVKETLDDKELEYQKLLVENSSLINEIDLAQDKVEAQEAEIALLKSELEELNVQTAGKVEHFKEALADKNFQITNLEANNAALHQELLQVKLEVSKLEEERQGSQVSDEAVSILQHNLDLLNQEKHNLLSEINSLQGAIAGLNEHISDMNKRLTAYELEIDNLKDSSPTGEQEAFIDRLFKQIDALNDQRLALLDEKEQMAGQLLKMNDVVGTLSQQIDSEDIDVTGLNNHRKNVILAKNSGENGERSHMKKQINDLVREIDKCIALLSA